MHLLPKSPLMMCHHFVLPQMPLQMRSVHRQLSHVLSQLTGSAVLWPRLTLPGSGEVLSVICAGQQLAFWVFRPHDGGLSLGQSSALGGTLGVRFEVRFDVIEHTAGV